MESLPGKPRAGLGSSRFLHYIVRALMEQFDPLIDALCALMTLEPVTAADIDQMRQEMQVRGLLPRDAIPLSVMKRCGLTAIASDDEGFDYCQGITLFQP
jgi:predicted nucleic acid-binding protein